jgi:hypothetical protein
VRRITVGLIAGDGVGVAVGVSVGAEPGISVGDTKLGSIGVGVFVGGTGSAKL